MKQQARFFLSVIFGSLFLFACGNKASDKKTDNPASADTNQAVTKPTTDTLQPAGIRLYCKDKGVDSMETPQADVLLVADGKETLIKSVNGCSEITKESYQQYGIPKDALAACGGWWAGAGDYFYVVLRNGKPVVFAGWQDEGQEDDGYHWEEVKQK